MRLCAHVFFVLDLIWLEFVRVSCVLPPSHKLLCVSALLWLEDAAPLKSLIISGSFSPSSFVAQVLERPQEGMSLMKTHLGLSVPRSLNYPVLGFCVNSHLLYGEDSLVRVEQCTDLWLQQYVIRSYLQLISFVRWKTNYFYWSDTGCINHNPGKSHAQGSIQNKLHVLLCFLFCLSVFCFCFLFFYFVFLKRKEQDVGWVERL